MRDYDVVVVGARIAGATLTMRLAEAGARVLLIDKARFPSDTLSSAFLWPPTVDRLARLGVLERIELGLPRLTTWLKFHNDISIRGAPPWRGTHPYALSPQRRYLDEILLDRALGVGSTDFWNPCCVEGLLVNQRGGIDGAVLESRGRSFKIHADWIVGADGRHSRIATWVRPTIERSYPAHRAWFVAYLSGWQGSPTEVVAGMQGADWFGVTSTYGGYAIASLSAPISALANFRGRVREEFWSRLHGNAEMTQRLLGARLEGPVRAAADLGGWLRRPIGPGWALVGDAAAHVDPITATGIGFSIEGAERLTHRLGRLDQQPVDELVDEFDREQAARYAPVFRATASSPQTNQSEHTARWRRVSESTGLANEHFANVERAVASWFEPTALHNEGDAQHSLTDL